MAAILGAILDLESWILLKNVWNSLCLIKWGQKKKELTIVRVQTLTAR